ncbi:uncharacterized protein LOC132951765 [Metopolophium dirhodum]|uniref:uncharacterized protein LOC132951765 n=1 Tax=Metopolophium dirhodum TaxID=44670 RepID=UPI00299024C7|nr:uncharacterized protein LOC132951765 [Metopolophium dirhodum]
MWKLKRDIEDDEDLHKPTLQKRYLFGVDELLKNLQDDDIVLNGELRSSFKNFLRMSTEDFENLICLIRPAIHKQNTNWRTAISVTEHLALTLRFSATGDSYLSTHLLSQYLLCLRAQKNVKKRAFDYNKIGNFPQCGGSIDGKHVDIEAPILSGSEFYNYKGTFSIVLFAIVDANYNFIYVNVGCQGRISDGGVFKSTGFQNLMENSTLILPDKRALPGRDKLSLNVSEADDAFPLSPNIIKPYSVANLNRFFT